MTKSSDVTIKNTGTIKIETSYITEINIDSQI
jgi:hypothetical protein